MRQCRRRLRRDGYDFLWFGLTNRSVQKSSLGSQGVGGPGLSPDPGRPLRIAVPIILLLSLGLCAACSFANHSVLTDPPQDSLNITWHNQLNAVVSPNDLKSQYVLAQKIVDTWSPDAYLHLVSIRVACTSLATPDHVNFLFNKYNYLHFYYPKEWVADVGMDFATGEGTLWVRKEPDRPPKRQKHLDLDILAVDLPQVLQILEAELDESDCSSAHIILYENMWKISYSTVQDGQRTTHDALTIDALTGKVKRATRN